MGLWQGLALDVEIAVLFCKMCTGCQINAGHTGAGITVCKLQYAHAA